MASAIAFDQLGNFDIVWNTSEIGEELYGRRFDTFGIQLGNAYRINAALPGDQHVGPNAVAVDSNGNMIVAWNEQVTQQAFVRRFNRVAGAIHSSEDFLIGAGGGVSVSVDGRGNTFASWLRAGDGVIARRLSPTFNKLYHDLYLEPGVTISGINFGARRAGDTNGDGVVNLVDLNNVRNNFGGEGVGDADGDGDVDLADLNAVRNNFGATLPGDGIVGDTNGDRSVDLVDLNNVRNNFGGQGLGDTDGNGTVDLEDLNAVRNNFGTGDSSPITTLSAADVLFSRLGDGDYKVIAPQFDSVKALFSSRMRSRHLSARLTSSTSWNDR